MPTPQSKPPPAPAPRVDDEPVLVKLTQNIPNINVQGSPTIRPNYQPSLKATSFYRRLATKLLSAQHIYDYANHVYNSNGKKETIDSLLKGPNKATWEKSLSNEFGRLAQGNNAGVRSNDAIDFIPFSEVPSNRDVTYATFVCDYRPLKTEPCRVRMVVGGDRLSYPNDPASPAASLLETKLLLNSTISDAHKGARFLTCDLKDHFLASPMQRPEYMKIPITRFPPDIIEKYQLNMKVHHGYIYCKIKRGMYELKQAALLAHDHLVKCLAPHGYRPMQNTIGMWEHETRPTKFCLCVDDFGVKYFSKEDADHLLDTLKQYYQITVDWNGKKYCGITIDWNYNSGYVDISMPKYILAVRLKFQHKDPPKACHAPHEWNVPAYGKRVQYISKPDESLFFK